MNNEQWRRIDGFEDYEISDHGRVKSYKRSKPFILRPQKAGRNGSKYHTVTLYKDGKPHVEYVHRLVLKTFVGEPPKDKPQTNHIDGDRLNNHLSNLEWVSCKENMEHAWRIGLITIEDILKREGAGRQKMFTDDEAREIYQRAVFGELSKDLAEEFGCHVATIQSIKAGRAYTDVSGFTGNPLDTTVRGGSFIGRQALEYYNRMWRGEPIKQLAEEAGVSLDTMYRLKRGETYNKFTRHNK